jgi:hypothetical protein
MGHQAVAELRRSGASPPGWQRIVTRLAPYLLLAVFFFLGLAQVVAASITFDEGPHLAVGYALLRTGDYRLQPVHIHPPLANVASALPLLIQRDLPDPAHVPGWEINSLSAITDAVVWQYPHPRRIAVAGRVPILLVGVILGAMVFRWARDLHSLAAGIVALASYAFDPNILAHSALITTDVAATTLIVATLYTLYRSMDRSASQGRRRIWLLLCGLFLGLAQLTKVSALMLIPVIGALLVLNAATSESTRAIRSALGRLALVMAVCAVTVWAGYGFTVSRPPRWPIALPAGVHVAIYRSLQEHYTLGHPTFALGRVSDSGWWWYFPVAFVLKTPLPVLILGTLLGLLLSVLPALRALGRRLASAASRGSRPAVQWDWVRSRLRSGANAGAYVALFPLGYAAAAFFSTVNIGYRHLLPILPFLYIGLGYGSARLEPEKPSMRRSARWLLALLGVWLVAGTARTLPFPLTYFNELAGGPRGGYRYLVDSNLDWGQNLWQLKAWLEQHDRPTVAYAHYSPARPDAYGIEATYLPPDPRADDFTPWDPQPGLYAIGATVLQGPYAPNINTYAWFRGQEPVARLGHALFVYEVKPQLPPTWLTLCVDRLDPGQMPALVGSEALRVLQPNCASAHVYPATEAPGFYVLPPDSPPPHGGELWLVLRDSEGNGMAHVFHVSSASAAPPAPAEASPEGPAILVGHERLPATAHPGQGLELITYWRVKEVPARPLSLMAHLVGEDGSPVAVGDGLGFPIEQWQEGDLIVQRHHWDLPQELAPGTELRAMTGAYWLDTMERWPAEDGRQAIVLQTLTIEK